MLISLHNGGDILICYTNDINLKYFYFNEHSYTTGTEVELTKNYINSNSNKIWKYARFIQKSYDKQTYQFMKCRYDSYSEEERECVLYFAISENELEYVIKEIVKPIPITLVPITQKKDWEVEGMFSLWMIYIAVLFFSLIFKEFYLIWIVTSFIFFNIRKKMLAG